MKVIDSIAALPQKSGRRGVALGNFDGVHRGHQQLISTMVAEAAKGGGDSVVFTFWPHPLQVLQGQCPNQLSPEQAKEELIGSLGADYFCLYPFDRAVADLSPEAFLGDLVYRQLQADHIYVGYNYTFGAKGRGDAECLTRLCREFGISLTVLPPVMAAGEIVSSSRIRQLIGAGEIGQANEMLGYCAYLRGQVICAAQGRGVGRQLGFPTANLLVPPGVQMPPFGVYAAYFQWAGGCCPAVVNLGIRPTFGLTQPVAEAHLLDFDGDLYEEPATIHFVRQIRRERSFVDLPELIEEIGANKRAAANILKETHSLHLFPKI